MSTWPWPVVRMYTNPDQQSVLTPILYLTLSAVLAASKLVGDKQREVEFMMRARHHLEYLFDSTHIEVAEGLVCMAYYSFSQV